LSQLLPWILIKINDAAIRENAQMDNRETKKIF